MSFTDNDSGFSGLCTVVSDGPIDVDSLEFKLTTTNTTVSPYCGFYIGIGDSKKTGSSSADYFETMRTIIRTDLNTAGITEQLIELDLSNYQGKYLYFGLEYGKDTTTLSYGNNNWYNPVVGTSTAFIDFDITPPPRRPPPPPAGYFLAQVQRNNSENEHVTKEVDTIAECYGVLREDCSLTDPVILFEYPLTLFVDANYLTIPVFGRSYFIRDVNAISAQLTEVYAHVDVLSSFADEIKANSGIVRRQANEWNLYLNDDVIRCYQNPIVETRLFPQGFEDSSYVLLLAGRRNVGVDTGQGGMISGDGIETGGAGNVNSKTTSGLVKYAAAQVGKPYWYGTFGNEASADLLAIKRNQYGDMYDISVVGGTPFEDQYGERVHDCVGLIKGYRWRENATGAEPVYRLAEDVNVQGLYAQCTRKKGTVTDPNGALVPVGAVLFYANMQHCGVHIGAGSVIEARGHRYGVVITSLATRPDFTLWGIPDWLQQV